MDAHSLKRTLTQLTHAHSISHAHIFLSALSCTDNSPPTPPHSRVYTRTFIDTNTRTYTKHTHVQAQPANFDPQLAAATSAAAQKAMEDAAVAARCVCVRVGVWVWVWVLVGGWVQVWVFVWVWMWVWVFVGGLSGGGGGGEGAGGDVGVGAGTLITENGECRPWRMQLWL